MTPPSRDDRRHFKNDGRPKVAFPSKREADAALEGAPPSKLGSLSSYQCPCGLWHHGNDSSVVTSRPWSLRHRDLFEMTCEIGQRAAGAMALENSGSGGDRRRAIIRRWKIGLNLPHSGPPQWRVKRQRGKHSPVRGNGSLAGQIVTRTMGDLEIELGKRAVHNLMAENQLTSGKRMTVIKKKVLAAQSLPKRLAIPTPRSSRSA